MLVTSQKEGAVTGGPAFVKAVGEEVLDATIAENLPGNYPFYFSCLMFRVLLLISSQCLVENLK